MLIGVEVVADVVYFLFEVTLKDQTIQTTH